MSSSDSAAPPVTSRRCRVTRLSSAGRALVCKEPLGPDAELELRHELAMLERLRGVPGVVQLVEAPEHPGRIVMEDAGERTLAMERPAGDDLPGLAVGLAQAVAGIHRRGVVHRNLNPAHVVVSTGGAPCLVGFGAAAPLTEIASEPPRDADPAGLAYLAPEQTGRTRPVDQRADLYALGATLYELATGRPPFESCDPLELAHHVLARVPAPPAEVDPAVPPLLSEIVMHLLEKDPDHRYQSAEAAIHDLERLRAPGAAGGLRVGERDVPVRLRPPSRLVGREREVAALEAAFAQSLSGRCRGVLVGGAPGVGKTALAEALWKVVTDAGGWFVAGKFDQYRRDLEFDAVHQALRRLAGLLIAAPEDELVEVRERILRAVGANAALLAAAVPEFGGLLGVAPDAGDPLTAQARTQQTATQVLRAAASPARPLVVFIDDLQWAGRTPLGAVDLALRDDPVEGLLLLAAYRDTDVETTQPLAAVVSREDHHDEVQHLRLADLDAPSLTAMVADVLHADRATASRLVEAIGPRTRGNPYETVELLNALHRDGVLTATGDGWSWDGAAVRAYVGESEASALPAGRLERMPAHSRELLEAMACMGGRVELSVLEAATGEGRGAVEQQLAAALDEGLLVIDAGADPAVRFRHDRIREAILDQLDPSHRRIRRLTLARQLAQRPELFAVAAEQYLVVADAVDDHAERRRVVGLLQRAAGQAALIGDHARMDALLSAALRLVDPADAATVLALRTGRHAALFSLGRLDEADEEYRSIEELCPAALDRADATAVQVRCLSHRTRFAEAIELGLEALRECGIAVPAAGGFSDGLDEKFARLHRWLGSTGPVEDLPRPEVRDPALLAASGLIDAVLPLAYYVADPPMISWLALEAVRIWIEHGPSRLLVGSAAHGAYSAGPQRDDYPAAYLALGRIIALGEAHGYEPGTSQARYMAATMAGWFEPIEDGVRAVHRAREGLIAGGELAYGGYSYQLSVPYSMDCAPSLSALDTEIEDGFAFLRRTGNDQTGRWLDSYAWLVRVLRSESPTAASEAVPLDRYAGDPTALIYAHLSRAITAAIFGDQAGLAQHSAAAMELLQAVHGFYAVAQIRLLRGLAVAEEARAAEGGARDDLLAELDELADWLSGWAVHAPDNFLHQLRLVEAERAWAAGDFRAAVIAFDAARREVAGRQRPWHRALIVERAARFFLAHGVEHAGYDLLAHARDEYLAWGATAKVEQIDWAYPPLRQQADAHRRSPVTTGTIDLLGILAGSQALSSETSIERLHARVAEVLGAMTGASGVQLVLWSDERREWLHSAPGSGGDVAGETAVPMTVLRSVQRTGEPLVVADAIQDDRFARDPYFDGADHCSVLAVPIFSRGALQGALLLENRLIRSAFSAERLDAVKLIAGQLAVSLDNAQLYSELAHSRARIVAAADEARRRIERDLHDGAQQRLIHTIITIKLARRALGGDAAGETAELLGEALANAEQAIDEVRSLARGIHPRILSAGGLRPALETLAGRSSIPVTLELETEGRLPEHVEVTAYFVVSEALTNAARHSQATGVEISLGASDGALRLSISDDGVGGADPAGGSGLAGLNDRVEALGGTLAVRSRAGQGTRLSLTIPLGED
jgi:signal transduction histidine kinase/tetratricopeptide (TPR) repeat protein